MTEDNKNLGVSVRVPAKVMEEIEEEIRKHPRPRPKRGELVEKAWEAYKSTTVPAGSEILSSDQKIVQNLTDQKIELTSTGFLAYLLNTSPLEQIQIEKLLRLLRSKMPGLPGAIKANIDLFDDARVLYERFGPADQQRVPALPSEEERVDVSDAAIAAFERRARGIAERVRRIGRDEKTARDRKTGPTDTPRKRG